MVFTNSFYCSLDSFFNRLFRFSFELKSELFQIYFNREMRLSRNLFFLCNRNIEFFLFFGYEIFLFRRKQRAKSINSDLVFHLRFGYLIYVFWGYCIINHDGNLALHATLEHNTNYMFHQTECSAIIPDSSSIVFLMYIMP